MPGPSQNYPEGLVFKGTSHDECETFISAVRRWALDQGTQRDNEWMAVFAASCFSGDAFYWYESLPDDVQHDWSRLRSALLAKFGRVPNAPLDGTSRVGCEKTSRPTLNLPVLPSVRKGYLRAVGLDDTFYGYVSQEPGKLGVYQCMEDETSEALLVSIPLLTKGEPFEIKIENQIRYDALVMLWNDWNDGVNRAEKSGKSLFGRFGSGAMLYSRMGKTPDRRIWTVSDEGELGVHFSASPDRNEAVRGYRVSRGLIWRYPSATDDTSGTLVKIIFEAVIL